MSELFHAFSIMNFIVNTSHSQFISIAITNCKPSRSQVSAKLDLKAIAIYKDNPDIRQTDTLALTYG